MKTVGIFLLSMVFTSCMHVGMMGSHDHHEGTASIIQSEPVMEKHVTSGGINAIAVFPPMKAGEEAKLTLRLFDATNASPISGAEVYLHAQYQHRITGDGQHSHAPNERIETGQNINIDEQVKGSPVPGLYEVTYKSFQEGEHTLIFHIVSIPGRKFDPEIIIEAKRTLSKQAHSEDMMQSGTSASTYVIIGAAVMSAMMIGILLANGRMF